MKSIRTKILSLILFTVLATAVAILLVAIVCINYLNRKDSNQLLVEIGQKNAAEINATLESMEHSVDSIYNFAHAQFSANPNALDNESVLLIYLDRLRDLTLSEASNTESVLAAYFRLSTDFDEMENPGFLFVEDDMTKRLTQIDLTDISLYDPDDIEHVGWYYVPQETGKATWVGPYMNRNLGSGMVSYVVPLYLNQEFTAVVGMDIDIDVLCNRVKEITAYETGTALLFDKDGNILYHREYLGGRDRAEFSSEDTVIYNAMQSSLAEGTPISYGSIGEKNKLYAETLSNGMILAITVPTGEINATRRTVILLSILFAVLVLFITVLVATLQTNSFLKPLDDLTNAAEQLSEGNMDVTLYYKGEDEIGTLSRTFEMMSGSLKSYFEHFHGLAYTDNLTGLNNKTAFTMVVDVIDSEIAMGRANFSVIVMDVNNLKTINDTLGHDKGDILLQHVAKILRQSIVGYPLYRVGGDEFCTIVNNVAPQDLIDRLQHNTKKWSEDDFATFGVSYQIAAGAASYEKGVDQSFNEVFHRADQLMYENKRKLKGEDHKETPEETDE